MIGALLTDRQKDLLTYWSKLIRPGRHMPLREDFDPVEIPALLSFITLIEREGADLRFRVVGTDLVRAWNKDFTGLTLDEVVSGAYRTQVKGLLDTCIETGAPLFSQGRFQWFRGRKLKTSRLMLPLAREEAPDRTAYIVIGQSFNYAQTGPKQIITQTITSEEAAHISEDTTRSCA